jgi:hypothetical protein
MARRDMPFGEAGSTDLVADHEALTPFIWLRERPDVSVQKQKGFDGGKIDSFHGGILIPPRFIPGASRRAFSK